MRSALVCSYENIPPSLQASPEATVSWMYKETEINNGSTLVNDIDMRQYYYVNSGSGNKRKSELFLSVTSVDDNGTFTCCARNKAGKAKAEFTLHVVVPMPPKPPQVKFILRSLYISGIKSDFCFLLWMYFRMS